MEATGKTIRRNRRWGRQMWTPGRINVQVAIIVL
jgi:hypothetical protein